MAVQQIAHPSLDERGAAGVRTRKLADPSSHAGWRPAANRHNPEALLEAQNLTQEPDLVSVPHGQMMVSPFTFYWDAAWDTAPRSLPAGAHGDPAAHPDGGLIAPVTWQ
jgi:hypothetical protein